MAIYVIPLAAFVVGVLLGASLRIHHWLLVAGVATCTVLFVVTLAQRDTSSAEGGEPIATASALVIFGGLTAIWCAGVGLGWLIHKQRRSGA